MSLEDYSQPATLPARLRQAGRRQSDLARYLHMDPSSLTRLIKGARGLRATEAVAIERFFAEAQAADLQAPAIDPPTELRNVQRIQVFGYLKAGASDHRVKMGPGMAIEIIDPDTLWNGLGELLGIRIAGHEMEPRLHAGEIAIAQRDLPPVPGNDVIVEFTDGAGLVRSFVSAGPNGDIVCRQYTPPQDVTYPRVTVKALHAVLWRK